jgi:hypothetical protein
VPDTKRVVFVVDDEEVIAQGAWREDPRCYSASWTSAAGIRPDRVSSAQRTVRPRSVGVELDPDDRYESRLRRR